MLRISFSTAASLLLLTTLASCVDGPMVPGSEATPADVARTIVPPGTVISVTSVDELYEAVNDPDHTGAVVELASGSYSLDPTKPNSGRLELQPGMTLRGVVGDAGAVVLNAAALTVAHYLPSGTTPTTGAVRLGRGVQSLDWLTVTGSLGTAAITTDLTSSVPPTVLISNVVVSNSRRGIDLRNTGSVSAYRVLRATVKDTRVTGSTGAAGQGIRVLNQSQALGAVIVATLERNQLDGNRVGMFVGNSATNYATILLSSTDDQFRNGGVGLGIAAGVGSAMANTVSVNMLRPTFSANVGALPSGFPFNAGVSVEGGTASGTTETASYNTAAVNMISPTFSGNAPVSGPCSPTTPLAYADIRAYGARSTTTAAAGLFNTASVSVVAATPQPVVCKTASDPLSGGPFNIVSVNVAP